MDDENSHVSFIIQPQIIIFLILSVAVIATFGKQPPLQQGDCFAEGFAVTAFSKSGKNFSGELI